MEDQNYYDILGVSTKATQEEITAAKNMLAKRYHPDANIKNGIDTTDKMQEILEAYGVLSDTGRRAEYDREISGRRQDMQTFGCFRPGTDGRRYVRYILEGCRCLVRDYNGEQ